MVKLLELWKEGSGAVRHSDIFRAAIIFGKILLVVLIVLGILIGVTFLLRRFFKNHVVVNRAHRVLIYIFTMAGVLALVMAGLLGVVLPIIPGIPFLIAAFFLMRKYHKSAWIEEKVAALKQKLHPAKDEKVQEKVNKRAKTARR
jgi:hypothetical protein